jgi:hypothetical protein
MNRLRKIDVAAVNGLEFVERFASVVAWVSVWAAVPMTLNAVGRASPKVTTLQIGRAHV